MVREYASIQRMDLTLRTRNDMHVDEARGADVSNARGKDTGTAAIGHIKEKDQVRGVIQVGDIRSRRTMNPLDMHSRTGRRQTIGEESRKETLRPSERAKEKGNCRSLGSARHVE